jgi:hypothetical protein
MADVRWIMEYSIRPLSWIRENYDRPVQAQPQEQEQDQEQPIDAPKSQQEPGYTGRVE